MQLTYRRAQGAEDARQIARIQNLCADDLTARLGTGHWSRLASAEGIRRRMETKTLFLVFDIAGGDEDAQPVATFTVGKRMPLFWPRKIWREPGAKMLGVFGIFVRPDLQRQGIGAWMMAQIEELARTNRAGYVRLDAYAANPESAAFYQKLGYAERGRIVFRTVPLVCFEKSVKLPVIVPPAAG